MVKLSENIVNFFTKSYYNYYALNDENFLFINKPAQLRGYWFYSEPYDSFVVNTQTQGSIILRL